MALTRSSVSPSILLCPNEVLTEILRNITDLPTLAKVVCTCRQLYIIAAPLLYASCPTLVNRDSLVNDVALERRVGAFLRSLEEGRIAQLVRHIVLDRNVKFTHQLGEAIQQCIHLDHLTLYTTNKNSSPAAVAEYVGDRIMSLSLRIVPDPLEFSEISAAFEESLRSFGLTVPWLSQIQVTGHVGEEPFKHLQKFTKITSLRVLIHPNLICNGTKVGSYIQKYTHDRQIASLHVNFIPFVTNNRHEEFYVSDVAMPHLKTIVLEFWHPGINFPTMERPIQTRLRFQSFSCRVLHQLIQNEKQNEWKYEFSGTHAILTDTSGEHTTIEEFESIINRIRQANLTPLISFDFQPSASPVLLNSGHPDILLDLSLDGFAYHQIHIDYFIFRVVPVARSLFINTGCITPLHGRRMAQGRRLYNFLLSLVEQAPQFQLSHLQNLSFVDSTIYGLSIPPPYQMGFLDARTIQPLSWLASVSSIEIDMAYCQIGIYLHNFSHNRTIYGRVCTTQPPSIRGGYSTNLLDFNMCRTRDAPHLQHQFNNLRGREIPVSTSSELFSARMDIDWKNLILSSDLHRTWVLTYLQFS